MTAGRTFELVRSVKGKGTRTISPRLRVVELDFFSIGEGIDIFFWIIQELKTLGFFSKFAYKQAGDFVLANSYSQKDPLMFRQFERCNRFETPMFIDSRKQFGHFSSPTLSILSVLYILRNVKEKGRNTAK